MDCVLRLVLTVILVLRVIAEARYKIDLVLIGLVLSGDWSELEIRHYFRILAGCFS